MYFKDNPWRRFQFVHDTLVLACYNKLNIFLDDIMIAMFKFFRRWFNWANIGSQLVDLMRSMKYLEDCDIRDELTLMVNDGLLKSWLVLCAIHEEQMLNQIAIFEQSSIHSIFLNSYQDFKDSAFVKYSDERLRRGRILSRQ